MPIIVLVPVILIIVIFEQIMPYHKSWNVDQNDFKTDLLQTFITLPVASQLSQFILPFILYFPITWITYLGPEGILERNFSLGLSFVIGLLICEFCYYWMHRCSHTFPALWNLHLVHHSAKRVYWANSGRFHFFDAILSSAAYLLPLIVLNASEQLTIMLLIFSGVTGFLEHVNIKFKAGYLNYIFNSAELHRWHHSEMEKESNHNFGKALIIWDLVFGTFLLPKDRKIIHVGVQDHKDPIGFINQFLLPFRKK